MLAEVNMVNAATAEGIGGSLTIKKINIIHNSSGVFLNISIYVVAIADKTALWLLRISASTVPITNERKIDIADITKVSTKPSSKNLIFIHVKSSPMLTLLPLLPRFSYRHHFL